MNPLLLALGFSSLALGAAGAVLPLLPTTPFLLLAAWSFARSSPRLHAAMLAHPRLGPPLRIWQEHRAISRRGKIIAIASLGASWIAIFLSFDQPWLPLTAALPMSVVAVFIARRPLPPRDRPFGRAEPRSGETAPRTTPGD